MGHGTHRVLDLMLFEEPFGVCPGAAGDNLTRRTGTDESTIIVDIAVTGDTSAENQVVRIFTSAINEQ